MDFLEYSSDEKEKIEREIEEQYKPHPFDFKGFFFTVKVITCLIIFIFIASFVSLIPHLSISTNTYVNKNESISISKKQVLEENTFAPQKGIGASSYMAMNLENNQIIVSKNFKHAVPIASLTKLMTAIIASENGIMSLPVVFLQNSTSTGEQIFESGEKTTLQNAIYPLLMESSNQAANAIARLYTEKSFVTMMNNKAQSLGMTQTFFADPSGISSENISSPYDLSLLAHYFLQRHPELLDITKTVSKTIMTSRGKKTVRNINLFENDPRFIGGKIGYTSDAGETMIALFKLPTKTSLFVVLGSKNRARDIGKLLEIANQ